MNPQLQALYLLGTIAATATVARVGLEQKRTLIEWIAIGSSALLLIEIIGMRLYREATKGGPGK